MCKKYRHLTILSIILISMMAAMTGCGSEKQTAAYKAQRDNAEGSAVSLLGNTAVITVYVENSEMFFLPEDKEYMADTAREAFAFIESQAAEFGKSAGFFFEPDEKGMKYEITFENDDISHFETFDYDSYMEEIVEKNAGLRKKLDRLNPENVMFLFLIDGTGESFSAYHWSEDGKAYHYEGAFIFKKGLDEDGETAVNGSGIYAKQILSLFGAYSLTKPEPTFGYTRNMYELVLDKYAGDIMTCEDPLASAEEYEITDVSGYLLGLCDDFEEIKEYPEFVPPERLAYTDRFKELFDEKKY